METENYPMENSAVETLESPQITFMDYEDAKPKLFPSRREVLRKTGIQRNLYLASFVLLMLAVFLLLPLSSSVIDRSAFAVPARKIQLTSPKDGLVTEIFVKEGEEVRKGAPLLRIESKEERAALEESRHEMRSLAKELSQERLELRLVFLSLQEAETLEEIGSVRKQVVREASLRHQAKRERIESLKARLKKARIRFEFLEASLQEGELRAPLDGWVASEISLEEKSYVRKGEFLLALASQDPLIEFRLKEEDYPRVSIGNRAVVTFYALARKKSKGEVVRFKSFGHPVHQPLVKRHALKGLIQLKEKEGIGQIRGGMTAKVVIEAQPKSILARLYHYLF